MVRSLACLGLITFICSCTVFEPGGEVPATAADETAPSLTDDCERLTGFLPAWLDRQAASVLLELPRPDSDGLMLRCLYTEGLRTGLGSNPVGLDRGQFGDTALVAFRQIGDRILLVQENTRFGTASEDEAQRIAARESFGESALWSGTIEGDGPDGGLLVDFTPFLVRDAHGTTRSLASAGQGSWRLDAARSLLDPEAALGFPDNTEFEALLTFAGDRPGGEVRTTSPDPHTISLVQHHSFVRLPDHDYATRTLDPRAGAFGVTFSDVAAPLARPVTVQFAKRHRLLATQPDEAISPTVDPIVYYVDRGAPEPVRSALIEGAGWWAEAFEAAGFHDGFRVELLPEGVHPLDVRYHVIEWVHRATRGWSYGHALSDPRTGEILKGHVSLGSLRVRQDRLLFEGLLGTAETGSGSARDPIELSLARIRQLAAHEVGHTLGLAHHFGASAIPNGSVMDYPAPNLSVDASGTIDTSAAYGVGIGPWDKVAITWLYGRHTDQARHELLAAARATIPPFVSDADARSLGSAHPRAHLWDNGPDAVAGLQNSLAVRRVALDGFARDRVTADRAMSDLVDVFTPVYLHHRYQLDAALKVIGGVEYVHALAGERAPPPMPANDDWQRRALVTVLSVLTPQALDIPDTALAVLVPPSPSSRTSREALRGRTSPAFDPTEAAAIAARQVVDGLLHPARCARLVEQHRRDRSTMSLDNVLAGLTFVALSSESQGTPRHAALAERIAAVTIDGLIRLAEHPDASAAVRARAEAALIASRPTLGVATDPALATSYAHLARRIGRFIQRSAPDAPLDEPVRASPPGSPIGAPSLSACGFDG